MRIILKEAISGMGFDLKAKLVINTAEKNSIITKKDAQRLVSSGIAELIKPVNKKIDKK